MKSFYPNARSKKGLHDFPEEVFAKRKAFSGNEIEFEDILEDIFGYSKNKIYVGVYKLERVMYIGRSTQIIEDDVTEKFKPAEEGTEN